MNRGGAKKDGGDLVGSINLDLCAKRENKFRRHLRGYVFAVLNVWFIRNNMMICQYDDSTTSQYILLRSTQISHKVYYVPTYRYQICVNNLYQKTGESPSLTVKLRILNLLERCVHIYMLSDSSQKRGWLSILSRLSTVDFEKPRVVTACYVTFISFTVACE